MAVVEDAVSYSINDIANQPPHLGYFIIITLLVAIILYKEIRKMKQDFKNNSELVKKEIWAEVEIIRGEQRVLGSQLNEVKDNIHKLNGSMQRVDLKMSSLSDTTKGIHTTLKFIALKMGGNIDDAIKESIDNLDE